MELRAGREAPTPLPVLFRQASPPLKEEDAGGRAYASAPTTARHRESDLDESDSVAWKTNSMPEAQPVARSAEAAGQLASAAAEISSTLASELKRQQVGGELGGAAAPVKVFAGDVALTPASQLASTPGSATPRMGPGWVSKQRKRWEHLAQKDGAPAGTSAEGGEAAGAGGEEPLHSLTLLMWQLQSDARSLQAGLQAEAERLGGEDAQGLLEAGRRLNAQVDEAVREVEHVLEEHRSALDGAEMLGVQVRLGAVDCINS